MTRRVTNRCVRYSIFPLLLIPALITGCSGAGDLDEAEAVATEGAPVDQAVLDNALLNESQFADGGYELEGRAWMNPEVAVSFYLDEEQNRIVSVLARAGADLVPEQTAPLEGETFAEFVTRQGQGHERAFEDVDSTAANVLLFDPEAPEFQSTNRLATFGRNDYCPTSWFDPICSQWAGYNAPVFPLIWNLRDRTYSVTQSLTGVAGVLAAACADVGTIDFTLAATGPRWGSISGSVSLTLNQGVGHYAYTVGAFREEEYCKTRVLGICVDYAFRVKFQTFTATATMTPRAGAEGHFCGTMTKNDDYYQGDWSCYERRTCPVLCPPGDTNPQCAYRGPRIGGP